MQSQPSKKRLETEIFRVLSKKHGLKINREASAFLVSFFNQFQVDQENLQENLDFIAKEWIHEHSESSNGLIEKPGLEHVIQSAFKKKSLQNSLHNLDLGQELSIREISPFFNVIDAFSTPKYLYNSESKTFIMREASESSLLGAPISRAVGYRNRFEVLKQRLLRHDTFRKPAFSDESNSDYYKITPIIHLKGKSSGNYLLFGMLTQIQEGKYYLEDLDALIQLQFSPTMDQSDGIFTRNCFVLAEGEFLKDGVFRVDVLSNPLIENRKSSCEAIPSHIDLFGGPKYDEDFEMVIKIEKTAEDATIIIVSDLWLDQPVVFEKLRVLFEGYSQAATPLAFVFIGNFQSSPFQNTGQGAKSYRESFDQLASLIAEFPELSQESHFVFVPGMNDPWAGTLLPRPPIPSTFTAKLSSKIKHIHFTTNPCRIKYCTKEIVIFREDLMNSMRRNAILPVNQKSQNPLEFHMVRTILDQAYLTPMPNEIKPVYWNHDTALMIYPQPHLLVLADRYEAYEQSYADCKVINPGQFPSSEFQFMVYQPASGEAEYSRIPSTSFTQLK